MARAEATISVEEFIEQILKTDIKEAPEWIRRAANSFPPGMWNSFLKQAMTEYSLQWFMSIIPIQIAITMRHEQDYRKILAQGKAFLNEIMQKAREFGIDVSNIHIMPIFMPK